MRKNLAMLVAAAATGAGTLLACPRGVEAADPPDETRRVYLWTANRAHSSITFETGHWGVVDIVGWFDVYDITVRSSALDFRDAEFEVRIDPASVRMPNPAMADNLRTLFFEAEVHPEIRFRSLRVEPTPATDELALVGVLTMKGISREIRLALRFNGYGSPPQGDPGFKLHGALDRLEFGVGGMELMEGTGHPMVDAVVRITCNLRLDYVRSEYR